MDSNCIFCKIIKGEIKGEIVYSDDLVIGIKDINPQAPVHILLIPKKHIPTAQELTEEDRDILKNIFLAAKKIAIDKNIGKSGYRVVMNCNSGAGQSVFHIHFHLLGGRKMEWPPG